jgi:hypothetical protein
LHPELTVIKIEKTDRMPNTFFIGANILFISTGEFRLVKLLLLKLFIDALHFFTIIQEYTKNFLINSKRSNIE